MASNQEEFETKLNLFLRTFIEIVQEHVYMTKKKDKSWY
jgi:hypothetical protein